MLLNARKEKDAREIAVRLNDVINGINMIRMQLDEGEEASGVRGEVARAREEYTNKILSARRIEGDTRDAYGKLAGDAEVAAAMKELGGIEKRTYQLGPRKVFDSNARRLERYSAAIKMGDIELRPDSGVYWVDVVLNGNVVKPMIFDTGASLISLPADYAEALGLRPSDADPVVIMQIADGSRFEARRMTLESVRVGEFTADAIECVVLPPEMKDAPPLLGQSFINNFSYQIHPGSNKLTLTALKK
jgi:aspartyl protease family protein